MPSESWPAFDDLDLRERATLTGGRDLWHIPGVERLGIERLRVTDGPSGARGTQFSGSPSVCVPCGTALASTWDRGLVAQVGQVIGDEVRRKEAKVLLAPTVNIHRHPLAGRNFECYSEDPWLTAEVAVAYIDGVQSRGVGCCIKHFVANDQELERMTISSEVDERTLREIYLRPFEIAVHRAKPWAVMSAYNRLHGTYCSEHRWLLTEVLRDEWGFDGLVMSDWYGTHSDESVGNGLDVEMPGPPQQLGSRLVDDDGRARVDEVGIDRAAAKVLQLMERAARAPEPPPAEHDPDDVVRQAAARAIVLLENDGTLPLDAGRLSSIAVLGPKAARPEIQGGGSAHVDPFHEISPLAGITARAAQEAAHDANADIEILHEPGVVHLPRRPLSGTDVRRPGRDERGVDVEFFADLADAEPVVSAVAPSTRLMWMGKPQPGVPRPFSARIRGDLVPTMSGDWALSLTSAGAASVTIDGDLVIDNREPTPGEAFYGAGSAPVHAERHFDAGQTYRLEVELVAPVSGAISGIELTAGPPEVADARERAVAAATAADVAVVVVGTNQPDSEGGDRPDMELPADQVALIEEVAAANPRTVVLVNCGSPITMDWADRVAAVAQVWYGGQEMGSAVADVLFGDVDASGRLPTTIPRRLADTPAFATYPGHDGEVHYTEGLLVGYRHYDANDVEPRYCFGHGLSYTTFGYGLLDVVHADDDAVRVAVDVTNTGPRAGREVVQLYVHAADGVDRPRQELRDFVAVDLEPGETVTVERELAADAFATWDVDAGAWTVGPGTYELRAGSSSRAIHATATVER
jgi:beta-glucosidase